MEIKIDFKIELEMLEEYLYIYCQLLPYCREFKGGYLSKYQIPTFDEFKKLYFEPAYSLQIPSMSEAVMNVRSGPKTFSYYRGVKIYPKPRPLFDVIRKKFTIIGGYIERGEEIPNELSKNFITCPLTDDPYIDL